MAKFDRDWVVSRLAETACYFFEHEQCDDEANAHAFRVIRKRFAKILHDECGWQFSEDDDEVAHPITARERAG